MIPKHHMQLLGTLALVLSPLVCQGDDSNEANVDRPNIIFLMADDQAVYSMGCYGTPGVKTPNMDQLAADGLIFDNHYDTTAICMASRANVMTGLLEYRTGCNFEHGDMLQSTWETSYPVRLRKAGYQTAFAGKFGFEVMPSVGAKGSMPEADFDRWGGGRGQTSYSTKANKSMKAYAKDYPHSTTDITGDEAIEFVNSTRADQPFCLSISFKAPHQPETPDKKFDHVYRGKTFTKPANFGREHGQHLSLQSQQGRQFERFHSWHYSDQYDEVMGRYHQQIHAVDVALGRIRKSLAEHGVEKNTVVIFTSDNGFLCGSHGYGSKVLPYEESTRVPLMIYDPRHANSGKGIRCGQLTGNIDFQPTILALAGIPNSDDVDGRSLLPLYQEPTKPIHSSLTLINVWGPEKVHSLSVVTRDWKYVYWPFHEGEFRATEELYHLAEDPLERRHVGDVAEHSTDLQRMRATYDSAVAKWKAESVPFHDYTRFGPVFTRR